MHILYSTFAVAPAISWLVPVCFSIMAIFFLAKPLKLLFRFLISVAIGSIGLFLCHHLGFAVGMNPITLVITGLLGLPGLLGLVILSFFL